MIVFSLGLVWPLVPIGILAGRFAASSPPLSRSELERRIADRDERIADLEAELGMNRKSED